MATWYGNGILVIPPSEVSSKPAESKRTIAVHQASLSTTARFYRRYLAACELMENSLERAILAKRKAKRAHLNPAQA